MDVPPVVPRTALLERGAVREVPWDAAVLPVDDAAATRGDGCFETLGVLGGNPPRVLQLGAHLERFARSAALLDLTGPPDAQWSALAGALVADVAEGQEAALRLTLTRGLPGAPPTAFATLRPVGAELLTARRDGVRVVSLPRGTAPDAHDGAPWLLGGAKTLSYAVHTAALREAARRGADDALFTATDGSVLEAPTATLVWWAGGELRTPPVAGTGVLRGTTQLAVSAGAAADGVATAERSATVAEVQAADAAWLLSSVRRVVEVTALDGVALRRDARLTARLRGWAEA